MTFKAIFRYTCDGPLAGEYGHLNPSIPTVFETGARGAGDAFAAAGWSSKAWTPSDIKHYCPECTSVLEERAATAVREFKPRIVREDPPHSFTFNPFRGA